MIDLFLFAPDDQSLHYLSQLFGSMNGIIKDPEGGGGGGSISLLGTMFMLFNSVILAVGALMIVYITVVGVIYTAHEGEFLGKKWANIWIPIRVVLGVAALVPTGSGYSGLQIIMMYVIVQGIGAADMLWNTVLSYVNIVGSPYATVTIPSAGVDQALTALFKGLVCSQTARLTYTANDNKWIVSGSGYYCGTKTGDAWCRSPEQFPATTSNTFLVGPGGQCGHVNYCDYKSVCSNLNSLACTSCTAQIAALSQIVPILSGIAAEFAQDDYQYRRFFYTSANVPNDQKWSFIYSYCRAKGIPQNQCCVSPEKPGPTQTCKGVGSSNFYNPNYTSQAGSNPQNPSDEAVKNIYWPYEIQPTIGSGNFIDTIVSDYMNIVTGSVTGYIVEQSQKAGGLGSYSDAASTGWILAGSYYYMLAKQNNNNLTDAIPKFSVESVDPSSNDMGGYRNNFTAAQTLLNTATNAQGGGVTGGSSLLAGLNGPMASTMKTVNQAFTTNVSGHGGPNVNPLSQLQITGMVLLITVEVLFVALLAITIIAGIAGFFDVYALGTGVNNPAGGTLALSYFFLVPVLFGMMGIMVSVGGLLGVYTPLIPYIVFTFGALGWMIATIEAMVAGPLVALGILSPSGQHELLGKAEPALMMLFAIFLRPSLMIFGLMASMLLAVVALEMINAAFWSVAKEIGTLDPLGFVIFLGAYVTMIVTALNKCFAAIHLIPERVMTWISGQAPGYGEEQALGEVKGGAEATKGGVKGGVEGGRMAGARAGHAAGKERGEKREEEKKAGAELKAKQEAEKK